MVESYITSGECNYASVFCDFKSVFELLIRYFFLVGVDCNYTHFNKQSECKQYSRGNSVTFLTDVLDFKQLGLWVIQILLSKNISGNIS